MGQSRVGGWGWGGVGVRVGVVGGGDGGVSVRGEVRGCSYYVVCESQ